MQHQPAHPAGLPINESSPDPIVVHPTMWGAKDVMMWLKGTANFTRDQFETIGQQKLDGDALLNLQDEDLLSFNVNAFGERHRILNAIQVLRDLDAYLKTTTVSLLGTQLLLAGRTIDERPLTAVADMASALTHALFCLDKKPPANFEAYLAIRQVLLDQTESFLHLAAKVDDGSKENAGFRKSAKEFVRQLLPSLQKLRAITTKKDKKEDGGEEKKLSVVKVQATGPTAGIYVEESHHTGVVFVSHIAAGSPAAKAGLLKEGDEIVQLNEQQIVGWREKAVLGLLKNTPNPLKLTLKLTSTELDKRIGWLMEQARAMRESVAGLTVTENRNIRRMTGDSHRRGTGEKMHRPLDARERQQAEARRNELLAPSVAMPNVSPIGRAAQEVPAKTESDCPINIVSPQGEDVWNIGASREIQWTSARLPKNRCLILHLEWEDENKHFCRQEIANRVLNTGSYTWKISNKLKPGKYQIAIVLPAEEGEPQIRASSLFFQLNMEVQQTNFIVEPARAIHLKRDSSPNFGFLTEGRFISKLTEGGPAHSHGHVHIGDEILELNGMSTSGLSTTAIVNLIDASGDALRMTVSKNTQGFHDFLRKFDALTATYKDALSVRTIELPACPKGTKGLGLVLDEQSNNIIITNVLVGSPAESHNIPLKSFVLQANDLKIDGSQRHEAVAYLDSKLNKPLRLVLSSAVRAVTEYTRGLAALREAASLSPEQAQESMAQVVATKPNPKKVTRAGSNMSSGSAKSLRDMLSTAGRSLSFSGNKAKQREPPLPADLNTPCAALTDPDCEGYLTKMGGSGITPKNWRRRWFVLKRGTVFYYKSQDEKTALGAFRLPGYLVMPAGPKKRLATKFGFKVGKPGFRSYYICADDPETMKMWMNAMSLAAIRYEKTSQEKELEEEFQQTRDLASRTGGFRSFRFNKDSRKSTRKPKGHESLSRNGSTMC